MDEGAQVCWCRAAWAGAGAGEGWLNMPPPNMLLWEKDYFELKALEKQMQTFFSLPERKK